MALRARLLVVTVSTCVAGCALAGSVAAQAPGAAAATRVTPAADTSASDGGGWLRSILGDSPDRDRVIGGLWAMHPFEPQFPELDETRGLGGLYGHWFGATFVNSYDKRTFIFGLERNWLAWRTGAFGLGAGYRVGLITGYDERLVELARHTPVLPFGGLLIWTQWGPLGLDSYYVYRAITLEASVVF